MKKFLLAITVLVFLFGSTAYAEETTDQYKDTPVFQTLERVEIITYGNVQGGGLLPRLNKVEKDIFGRSLPGSLTERQTAMLNFLEKGTDTQPSLLFKISVAEWAVAKQSYPNESLMKRIDTLESLIEGVVQGGAYASRIERLLVKILPDGVSTSKMMMPASTIVKASLTKTLTVRNVKVDDKVILKLIDDIVLDDTLLAPKGSRVLAHITKVKPPRSFGRSSEIEINFDDIEVLTPQTVKIVMGEAAKKAMEADSAVYGAAGASFAGAVLLGPVGLAGGFLVRGNDKQLKEGTLFYLETVTSADIKGYKVPKQISPMVTSGDMVHPQGSSQTN
ncbi:MAG: hypothetical protein RRZ70_06080 [Synergistaceae bacterium]